MSNNVIADESVQWFLLNVRRQLARMDQAVSDIPDTGAATALEIAQEIRWKIAAFLNQDAMPIAPAHVVAAAGQRPNYQ